MKNLIKSLFVVGVIASAFLISSSCEKNDVVENKLVGKWQSVSYQYTEYDATGNPVLAVTYKAPIFLVTMELNADGTGKWVEISDDDVDEGSWYLSDKRITITMSSFDVDTFDVISVTSKELILRGNEVYDDLSVEYKLHFEKI